MSYGKVCESCGSTAFEPTKHVNVFGQGTNLIRCTSCGLKFYDRPCPIVPAVFYASGAYDDYVRREQECGSPCNSDPATADVYRRCADSLYRKLWSELGARVTLLARVFEVGCGSGRFLALGREKGAECWGCDINAMNAEIACRSGAHVVAGFFGVVDVPRELDAVIMLDVIEHTPTPRADLERAFEHTRRGGGLLLKTFYDEWHETLEGFDLGPQEGVVIRGRKSGYFSPAAHPYHFDAPVLRALVERVGYRIEHQSLEAIHGQVTLIAVKP